MIADGHLRRCHFLFILCGCAVVLLALPLGVIAPDADCNAATNCNQCLVSRCLWCSLKVVQRLDGGNENHIDLHGLGKCFPRNGGADCFKLNLGTFSEGWEVANAEGNSLLFTHVGSSGAFHSGWCTTTNTPFEVSGTSTCGTCAGGGKQWCKQALWQGNTTLKTEGFCARTEFTCDATLIPALPNTSWRALGITDPDQCGAEPPAPPTPSPPATTTPAPSPSASTTPAPTLSTTSPLSACLHTNCDACKKASGCSWCGAVVELMKGSTKTSHELAFGKCVETEHTSCPNVKIGTMGGIFELKNGGVELVYKDFKDVDAAKCTTIDTPLEALIADTANCESCMAKNGKAVEWCEFDAKKGDLTASGGMCMPKDSKQCSKDLTPLPSDSGINLTVQLLKDSKHCSAGFAKFAFLAPASLAAIAAGLLLVLA